MPNIGHLRHQIELQKPTNTRDAGGGITESFTTLANLFAKIENKRGTESLRQGQVKEQTTHVFTIRYRKDIGTNYRILYDDDFYNIRYINNIDHRDRYLEVECELGVTG